MDCTEEATACIEGRQLLLLFLEQLAPFGLCSVRVEST